MLRRQANPETRPVVPDLCGCDFGDHAAVRLVLWSDHVRVAFDRSEVARAARQKGARNAAAEVDGDSYL